MKLNGVGDGNGSAGMELFQRVSNPVQAPKEAAEAAASGPPVIVDIAARNDTNMMADFFVHEDSRRSRYVQANMDRMRDLGAMRQRQNSIVQQGIAAVAALGETTRYAEIILEGRKAEEKLEKEKGTAVTETSETVLEENREDMEERAEEAVNPVDENGNPVQDAEAKEAIAKKDATPETDEMGEADSGTDATPGSALSAMPGESLTADSLIGDSATSNSVISPASESGTSAAGSGAAASAANATPTTKRVDLTV